MVSVQRLLADGGRGLLVMAGGLSCSSADMAKASFDTALRASDEASGEVVTTNDTSQPHWWRLSASLEVVAGQLAAGESELEVTVLERNGTEVCSELFLVESTNTEVFQPDPSLIVWWSIGRGAGAGQCAAFQDLSALPETFFLGVGDLHPELEAVAGQVPMVPEEGPGTLNGAFASVDPDVDDLWVFGFAGDELAWSGRSGPATVAPLADGTWTIVGVYGFPLP